MNQKDYEQEFERLAAEDPIVRAALFFHERDRSSVNLVLAMKIMVVELARQNTELKNDLIERVMTSQPAMIRFCDSQTCPSSKTATSSEP